MQKKKKNVNMAFICQGLLLIGYRFIVEMTDVCDSFGPTYFKRKYFRRIYKGSKSTDLSNLSLHSCGAGFSKISNQKMGAKANQTGYRI